MTLVEVMMAFAILVTGLVTIFAVLHAGLRSHKRAINETEASMVAASVMSELRAEFFRGQTPKPDAKGVFHESTDFPNYKYNRQVVLLEPQRRGVEQTTPDREYFVRVEVRWADQGDNKSLSVDTVMFCNRIK